MAAQGTWARSTAKRHQQKLGLLAWGLVAWAQATGPVAPGKGFWEGELQLPPIRRQEDRLVPALFPDDRGIHVAAGPDSPQFCWWSTVVDQPNATVGTEEEIARRGPETAPRPVGKIRKGFGQGLQEREGEAPETFDQDRGRLGTCETTVRPIPESAGACRGGSGLCIGCCSHFGRALRLVECHCRWHGSVCRARPGCQHGRSYDATGPEATECRCDPPYTIWCGDTSPLGQREPWPTDLGSPCTDSSSSARAYLGRIHSNVTGSSSPSRTVIQPLLRLAEDLQQRRQLGIRALPTLSKTTRI